MSGIIDTLRKDHSNIEQLLQILKQEVLACERDGRADLDILSGIINYRFYPDRYHHPTEDLIFGRLQIRSPELAANVIGIVSEHGQAGHRLGQWPGSWKRSTQESARRHIELEEQQLFRAVPGTLTAQDWTELDNMLAERRHPLIHAEAEACFERLVERIVHWEHQDRAERARLSQGW